MLFKMDILELHPNSFISSNHFNEIVHHPLIASYGHDTLITALSGQRNALSSHNNTRILSSSTDNTLRLWKIEANTQMVYRGRRADMSMECAAMVSQTHFVTGGVNGSLNVFAADKKKSVYSVKVGMNE